MDLVPEQDRLIAEVNVQPNDIDVVHPGLQAEVRLPAFKQRLVPYLHGHVTFVARRRHARRAHAPAVLPRPYPDRRGPARRGCRASSGARACRWRRMIQIGERSFCRYITQPIRDSFHRAFREQ